MIELAGYSRGYAAGVAAAREAVAASVHYELCVCDECLGRMSALDAIDALRLERSGNPDTPQSADNPDKRAGHE